MIRNSYLETRVAVTQQIGALVEELQEVESRIAVLFPEDMGTPSPFYISKEIEKH